MRIRSSSLPLRRRRRLARVAALSAIAAGVMLCLGAGRVEAGTGPEHTIIVESRFTHLSPPDLTIARGDRVLIKRPGAPTDLAFRVWVQPTRGVAGLGTHFDLRHVLRFEEPGVYTLEVGSLDMSYQRDLRAKIVVRPGTEVPAIAAVPSPATTPAPAGEPQLVAAPRTARLGDRLTLTLRGPVPEPAADLYLAVTFPGGQRVAYVTGQLFQPFSQDPVPYRRGLPGGPAESELLSALVDASVPAGRYQFRAAFVAKGRPPTFTHILGPILDAEVEVVP